MMRWLLVLTIVVVLIFVGALVAALRMFCRPAQIALRRELRGEIPTSVYPMDVKRVPPPSLPQRGIPKQIFRTWEDDSWKTKCRKAYDHTAKIVPDWPQKVYTSEQRRQFVHKVYADYPDIIDAYELCNYGVMECDMWRHLVIYHYGGLYLDMKSGVLDPIDLDLNVDKAYVGLWNNMNHTYLFKGGEYQNWWVLAPPKCQFLWKLIWQIVRNILHLRDHGEQDIPFFDVSMYGKYHNKTRVMATGGPLVYSYIAHKYPYTVTSIGHVSNKYFEFCRLAGSEYNQKAKTHYSQQTKPLLKPHVVKAQLSRPLKLGKVPKVLHMTYINKESVPQFVWDNLKQYTQGYDLRFYSDEDCDFYLWKHYGPQVLEAWYMQAKGAHKADLFRYAVLAREGGVYLDIKVDVRKPLGQMFDHSIPFTSVETRFPNKRNIHNGILSAAPHHPVLYNALDFACKGDKRKNMEYHVNIDYLHKLLRREVDGQHLRIGRNDGRRGSFVLHEEKLKKGNDRYGWDNSIVNAQGTVLAKTRYHSYGSWNKQPSPLVEIKNYTTKVRLSHKIPNNIFQNHKRRMVPAGMANAIRKIQDHGSNYSYTFYDDETSRQYIAKHYPSALEAFDTLIPGAYKSDLFRIIRLYVEGGVYFDAPFSPYDSTLKLDQILQPTDTFVSANDRGHGLYNAFMASIPKHPILKGGIAAILKNVKNKSYGIDVLDVTGPTIFKNVFEQLKLGNCCDGHYGTSIRFFRHPGKHIEHDQQLLYNIRYPQYENDRLLFWKDTPHYSILWRSKNIYKQFKSHRLGNLIDAWYFGSLGSQERQKEFLQIQRKCQQNSFGNYLRLHDNYPIVYRRETLKILIDNANKFWAVYDYGNIVQTLPHFRNVLRQHVIDYISKERKHLLYLASRHPYDCVVHYRVGDFVSLGQTIDPMTVAKQCKLLNATKIAIMDGGILFRASHKTMEQSKILLLQLKNNIKQLIPDCHVTFESNDPDMDFFMCMFAPKLVTAGGSFAVCAAIGNINTVRTPACKNTNFCKVKSQPIDITSKWKTYLP